MNSYMLEEPNWIIVTFIGVIVGYLFPYIFKSFYFIYRILSKKNHIEGHWYGYYLTYENNIITLKKEDWNIKKGFINKFTLDVKTSPNASLTFLGKLEEENGQLLVYLNAKEFKETVFGRFVPPVPGNDNFIVGLCVGLDFNGYSTAAPTLLSRNEISDIEINKILAAHIEIESESKTMRIKS